MARILVVDDESLIRVLVADVGESLGHEVLTAASIKEGQDLAQRGVDIVLLDVLLPDGDGLAHVETFSQLPGRPDVIIITGHGNADAAEAALRSGAWEYLVKPLRVRDLSKALTQAVQWRNSRDSQSRSLLRHPDIIGKSPALAEALEAASQGLPYTEDTAAACASFMQVSGLKYTVDTAKEYDKGEAYGDNWFKAASLGRVTIDEVNGQPFDAEATYAVITSNANFKGMDSSYIFPAAAEENEKSTITTAVVRDVVWMYISEELGNVIGDDYAEAQGRIVIK